MQTLNTIRMSDETHSRSQEVFAWQDNFFFPR
jgi:hypothetical protein